MAFRQLAGGPVGRRGSGGFTVLELLIVIAVIGVLGVVVQHGSAMLRHDAAVTSCKRAVNEIQESADIVRARTASYPGRVDGSDRAANPLLVASGSLSRWPKGAGYALIWTGSTVDVVTTANRTSLGAGPAACERVG